MRYNQRATFIFGESKKYDPIIGRHVVSYEDSITLPCHISDLGLEKSATIYGSVKTGRKVIRTRQVLTTNPSHVLINDKRHEIEHIRFKGCVFYVVEAS